MRSGGDNRGRLLLISLIVTSLFLITLDLRGVQVITGLRNGSQSALSPVQSVAATVFRPVGNFFSDVTHLGRTRGEINKLKAANEKLRQALINRKNADAELTQLKSVLDLAGTAKYKVVSAKVISVGSTSSFTQTITIDAGTNDGVRQNMTVITGLGLVGVVKISYPSSALVQLTTDPAFRVGARVAGSQQIGILSGQGTRKAVLQLLDNQTTLKVGDVILARGSQNNRPFVPGVPIGEVTTVDNAAGAVTQTADVKLYVNFAALSVVSVVIGAPKADPRDALVPKAPVPTPVPTVTVYAQPSESPTP
ncbi:MAG: cell shape-determining protein [Actinobacteria bacterium]|uniref:Cell shape-determining protein MreC n=1 Tax=freshwater metagenome TaxID=449393 RepID=A0A6J7KR24_9ZZZZ|nr:cell shape-determining protein [Actinomycetota bacterium]